MSAVNAAVTVADLVKEYPNGLAPAVDGLSFSVPHGEVFGLLGPNGAGKTTTIGVLTTRVLPTSGTARVGGIDVVARPARARRALAVVPQRNNLDRSLTVRQNLLFHAAYHGFRPAERKKTADRLLERMGLGDFADARVDFMSGGQAQRVMIARALMHRPSVLFLDEPATGLDPQARLFVHERIAELREDGVTVVITTHDMDEAEKLCDRVGVVDHGRLIALDAPETLTRGLPGHTTLTVTLMLTGASAEDVTLTLCGVDGVERVERLPSDPARTDEQFRLYTSLDPAAVLPHVIKMLEGVQCRLSDLAIGKPSLEDVFIHLTGRELR
ncbi:ABC transporter ATP-binding protein [Streptomyces sp. NPDC048612]|uniref:ABC transporter ATP-binding protein n=1 Tax=Streptomyces sp. NPDC048612 TaxID=3365579 RepID=UPI00371A6B5A